MFKRALLALALVVGASWAPALATPSVTGVGDVRVLTVRFIPSPDAGAGLASGGLTYVLANVELTNGTAHDFTPSERYQGTDSGSSALIGVSNAHRPLKQGDKRRYTVGFRSPDPVITGTVSYEP